MKLKMMRLCGAVICGWCLAGGAAFAQNSAFTYQGRLEDNGQPANGSYDLAFSLYAFDTGTDQIGSKIFKTATPVSGGLFTTTLDFGLVAFDGQERWLQLEVRSNSSGGSFTILNPRQPVLPTPYALHAFRSDYAGSANAAITVNHGVYDNGAYADPSWITSLSGSKITGDIPGRASGFLGPLAGNVAGTQGATVIVNDAVTTAKIANSAVTSAKIAAGAVGNSQIAAGAVTEGKITAAGLLVNNLNADLLDGLDSAVFAQRGTGPESKNVGVCNTTGTAAAWDSATRAWVSLALGGSSSRLLGSGGNIGFANNSGKGGVWSYVTKTWIQVNLGDGWGGFAASKGNFVLMNNAGKAAAWSDSTRTWTQVSLGTGSGFGGIAASGGNFVVANSIGGAAAWNDATKGWSTVTLGGAYGELAGSGGNFVFANNSGTAAAWSYVTGTWTNVVLGGATGSTTGSDAW